MRVLLAMLMLAACDPGERSLDGGQPVSCGQLGEPCCVGTVNDAAAEVCNNDTKCEDGTCIEIVPIWDVDAGVAVPCGLLGQPCCYDLPTNTFYCYAPYTCDGETCQGRQGP